MSAANKVSFPAIARDLELSGKVDNLNSLLNQNPPKQWLKVHKGVKYQPIERVKNNLVTIFQDYDWSLKEVKVIANSIVVTGTLSVVNPVTGRVRNIDGVGAWPIQLSKGSKPLAFDNIIQDAIQKNAPAAESLALKSAAAKLGKLFSNGDSEVDFAPIYVQQEQEESHTNIVDVDKCIVALNSAKDKAQLQEVWKSFTKEERNTPEVLSLKDELKEELA